MLLVFLLFSHQIAQNFAFFNTKIDRNSCPDLWRYPGALRDKKCTYNPDIGKNSAFAARRRGHEAVQHYVETEDGYIINLFQILPRDVPINKIKAPILIQGEMMSNSDYFTGAGERSLAYALADAGHEVWLGNLRGTTYGNYHKNLSVSDYAFWEFGWDELKLDIKAQIEYIAQISPKGNQTIYIGHCLGNSLFYIFALEYPELAKQHVRGTISLSPANFLDHSKTFKPLVPIAIPILKLLKTLRINGLFFHENFIHPFLGTLFRIFPHIGKMLIDFIFGKSHQFPTQDLVMMWTNFIPCGVSVNELLQLFQISKTGKFAKLDYGKSTNLKKYGSETPPEYDLSKFDMPVYLFYGLRDRIADPVDANRTYHELGSTEKSITKVPKDNDEYAFAHFDFLNGLRVKELFYEPLLLPLIAEKFPEKE